MKYKDYYKLLGVERSATGDEVKKAYRKLARKYHPDVSREADAKEKFQDVSEAYETLRDKEKRAAYDQLGSHRPGQDFRPPPGWFDRYGQGRADSPRDMDLSDLFESMGIFGSAQRRQGGFRGRSMPIPGENYEVVGRLALEEVFRGAEREMRIGDRSIRVRIPKGATDGQRLRLRGKGGPGENGGPPGDLFLQIALEPHPLFKASGHDLDIELPIAPWEAALGAQVEVPTLGGAVSVRIPAGSKGGQKLRLAGKGLPKPDEGTGDLYAVINIVVPPAVSEHEKKLYEELRDAIPFDPRSHFKPKP